MSTINLDELKRKMTIYSTPLDIDEYITKGLISRYKNTKTQFVIHCSTDELPEEITFRTNKIKHIKNKDDCHILVFELNLKVHK